MKRSVLSAAMLLSIVGTAHADPLPLRCHLIGGFRGSLPDVRLLIDYDAHTVTWQDAKQNPVLQATMGGEVVTFHDPYTEVPASFDRKTGALHAINDATHGQSEYLCQLDPRKSARD